MMSVNAVSMELDLFEQIFGRVSVNDSSAIVTSRSFYMQ